jgi:hypothetical protein
MEVVIVATILSIGAAVAAPYRDQSAFALYNTHALLLADLRMARGSAIANGTHFRLDLVDAGTYTITRMMEAGGGWVPEGDPEIERELPPSVSISGATGVGYEFNTRGLLTTPPAQQTITLVDSASGDERTVDVWPSGQVIAG